MWALKQLHKQREVEQSNKKAVRVMETLKMWHDDGKMKPAFQKGLWDLVKELEPLKIGTLEKHNNIVMKTEALRRGIL